MAVYLFHAEGDFLWLIVRECNGTIGRLEADFACFPKFNGTHQPLAMDLLGAGCFIAG
jgi:hypothetical protein